MRIRLLVCVAVAALAAAACGTDDPADLPEPADGGIADEAPPSGSGDSTVAHQAGAAATGDVPDLPMIDVHTAETVGLRSVVDGATPTLLWFWAPH